MYGFSCIYFSAQPRPEFSAQFGSGGPGGREETLSHEFDFRPRDRLNISRKPSKALPHLVTQSSQCKEVMASRVLPLLTLLCVFGGVYCQASNQTSKTSSNVPNGNSCRLLFILVCGDVLCPQSDRPVDPEGNRRDECCNNFVTGCCSSAENTYLRLM